MDITDKLKLSLIDRQKAMRNRYEKTNRDKFNAPTLGEQRELILELEKIKVKIATYEELINEIVELQKL